MMRKLFGKRMKKLIITVFFLMLVIPAAAQVKTNHYPELYGKKSQNKEKSLQSLASADSELSYFLAIAWPLNPMLVVEDKKAHFALTKELSLGFPVFYAGKTPVLTMLGAEYSYVFRQERNSHIRAFADVLIPIQSGDFFAFLAGAGGGYFTDTKKSGIFPQASLSLFVPLTEGTALKIYVKGRNTFMLMKEESNIFDISIGAATTFYLFGW